MSERRSGQSAGSTGIRGGQETLETTTPTRMVGVVVEYHRARPTAALSPAGAAGRPVDRTVPACAHAGAAGVKWRVAAIFNCVLNGIFTWKPWYSE